MWNDLLLQAGMLLIAIFAFLYMQNIPQKVSKNLISKLRNFFYQSNLQSKRHFIHGAQLLAQARSSSPEDRPSVLEQAVAEADKAVELDPKDAATHILKALILDLQGFSSSAIDSLDVALSPLAVKSLSDGEKADALYKRAELRSAAGQVDLAVEDLVESVRLSGDDAIAKVFGLLGQCYEKKGLVDEAQKAYENAVRVQPSYKLAQLALERLVSSSS